MLIGERLIKKNLITQMQLDEGLAEQKATGEFIGEILVRKRFVREEDLMKVLSEQFDMPFVSLKNQYIDWGVVMKFSSSLIVERKCLPFRREDAGYTVAITNPLDALSVSQAEAEARNEKVKLVLVVSAEMQNVIQEYRKRLSEATKRKFEA